jgi:hypothetical protein
MNINDLYHSFHIETEKNDDKHLYKLYGFKKLDPLKTLEFFKSFDGNGKNPLLEFIKEFNSVEELESFIKGNSK